MEIRLPKATLSRLLARVNPAVPPRASIAILACVLLDAKDGVLVARTSNMLTSIRAHVDSKVTTPGAVAVGAKAFADAVKKLAEGEITVKLDGNKLVIRSGKSRLSLPTAPAEDFPPMPVVGDKAPVVVVKASALASLLASVTYASSGDDTRPHLCGVSLDADPGVLRGTTTDGHRLATSTVATISGAFEPETLPTHAFSAVKSFAGDKSADAVVSIAIGHYLHLTCGDVEVAAVRSTEKFPPWERVVPKDGAEHRCTVSRDALLAGVNLCAAVLDKGLGGVRMHLSDGQVKLEAADGDGEASTEIDCDYAGAGVTVCFSPAYMAEAIGAFESDELIVETNGEKDPLRLTATTETTVGVVMPMRLT